jgi:hypothetical protein
MWWPKNWLAAGVRWLCKTELRTFFIGVILILGGIVLEDHLKWPFLPRFAEHLGIAFVVGAIITAGIERAARRTQIAEINDKIELISKNVIAAIYGKKVSDDLFHFVEQYILNSPFARTELSVHMNMTSIRKTSLKDDNDPVLVNIRSSFILHNLAKDEQIFPMSLFIERPWDPVLGKYVKVLSLNVDNQDFSEEELQNMDDKLKDTKNFIFYGKDFSCAGGQPRRFNLEYQLVKYARDQVTWRTVWRTDGMFLEVTYPPELEMCVEEMHSTTAEDETPASRHGVIRKRIRKPMMPHNGFEVWWRPKAADGTGPESTK